MGKVNINFANVETKLQELETFTNQNLIEKVEKNYLALGQMLEDMEGSFKDEYIPALESEKQAVLNLVQYIEAIYALIKKSSIEFETVDTQHEKTISEFLTD